MSKPIYDQPDHPNYGPVRRLHIMLMQLTADQPEMLGRFDAYMNAVRGHGWDYEVDTLIATAPMIFDGTTLRRKPMEAASQRFVLDQFLCFLEQTR